MTSIPQVCDAMQTLLTSVAEQAARTSGFVQRASKLTAALFAQTLVFGFWSNPSATRDHLAQTAAALGLHISPQGIDQRMSEAGATCLLHVLQSLATQVVTADPLAVPLLERFTGVYIQDSTHIALPSTLAHIWRGSGNQHTTDASSASLKVSLRVDLLSGALSGPHLDHGLTSDRSTLLQDQPLPAGGLRLADLGYFDLSVLQTIAETDGYWLSRFQATTAVFDTSGQRLDLVDALARQSGDRVELPIVLGARHRLPCRLLAARVGQEVADQRRRRLRAEAKRRGRQPNALLLALAGWTLLVTNVPPEQLSVGEAMVLARVRWQIECMWKLWKSHGKVDSWRSRKRGALLCELYAKLIAQVLQHWIVLVSCWQNADRSMVKAAASLRLHVMGLAIALSDPERLRVLVERIAGCLASGCRITKSKTSPRTFQHLLALPDLLLA